MLYSQHDLNRFFLSCCAFIISRYLKNLDKHFTGNAILVIKNYKGKSCKNILRCHTYSTVFIVPWKICLDFTKHSFESTLKVLFDVSVKLQSKFCFSSYINNYTQSLTKKHAARQSLS